MQSRNTRGASVNRGKVITTTQKKYEQVDASVFAGPATWHFLFCTATTYDGSPEAKQAIKNIVDAIRITFPCPNCRKNFEKHLKEIPLNDHLDNKDELFLWLYLMKDKVNQLKKVKSPTLESVKKYYFETLGMVCKSC